MGGRDLPFFTSLFACGRVFLSRVTIIGRQIPYEQFRYEPSSY